VSVVPQNHWASRTFLCMRQGNDANSVVRQRGTIRNVAGLSRAIYTETWTSLAHPCLQCVHQRVSHGRMDALMANRVFKLAKAYTEIGAQDIPSALSGRGDSGEGRQDMHAHGRACLSLCTQIMDCESVSH